MKRPTIIQNRLTYVIVVATLLSCSSYKTLPISKTNELRYNMIIGQESKKLIINVFENNDIRSYDYSLGNNELTGTITMSNNSKRYASEMYHTFNGLSKDLIKSTSIWLSDTLFNSIRNGRTTPISYRTGLVKNQVSFKLKERQILEYLVNGKRTKLAVLYCEDLDDKNYKIWIWDNESDPLILRLNMGWEIMLNEISSKS